MLRIVYGSTEMGLISTFCPSVIGDLVDFTAGYPVNNIEIKIVELHNNDQKERDATKIGEILIRSSKLKFQVRTDIRFIIIKINYQNVISNS